MKIATTALDEFLEFNVAKKLRMRIFPLVSLVSVSMFTQLNQLDPIKCYDVTTKMFYTLSISEFQFKIDLNSRVAQFFVKKYYDFPLFRSQLVSKREKYLLIFSSVGK